MAIKIGTPVVKATSGQDEYVTEWGTVEVTIGNETRTLEFKRYQWNGCLTVLGIAVRVGHGTKIWKGEITQWPNGNMSASRTGNFRHPRGTGITVVGFYEDTDNISQHSSQKLK